MAKRVSRSEMRRQRQQLLESRSERQALPSDLQARAEAYVPNSLDAQRWAEIRPGFLAIIATTSVRGADAFSKRCYALASYLAWCQQRESDLCIEKVMRFELIDEYAKTVGGPTGNTQRSQLRNLARDANPDGVPAPPLRFEKPTIKPPYTPREMAAIKRIALSQPTVAQRRAMCAVVGLARGAGLDSMDFRHLTCKHVEDREERGLWVSVNGPRTRLVPVRRSWEDLVRTGVAEMRPDSLVIGESVSRRNVAAKIIEKATILGNAPKIEVSRMRTTWLADLLSSDVPLAVVMAVSGLESARTITEVLKHVDQYVGTEVAR